MAGNRTHEEQIRTFERKDDAPKPTQLSPHLSNEEIAARSARTSATPPSRNEQGYSTGHSGQQESRDHNQRSRGGQSGHTPQQHGRAEEKH